MYVYIHMSGTIHLKSDIVVNPIGAIDYFDSPFVKEWHYFNTDEEARDFIDKIIRGQNERESLH